MTKKVDKSGRHISNGYRVKEITESLIQEFKESEWYEGEIIDENEINEYQRYATRYVNSGLDDILVSEGLSDLNIARLIIKLDVFTLVNLDDESERSDTSTNWGYDWPPKLKNKPKKIDKEWNLIDEFFSNKSQITFLEIHKGRGKNLKKYKWVDGKFPLAVFKETLHDNFENESINETIDLLKRFEKLYLTGPIAAIKEIRQLLREQIFPERNSKEKYIIKDAYINILTYKIFEKLGGLKKMNSKNGMANFIAKKIKTDLS